jgi:16S rRNA (cytidine1402-2'-O)-methyltransferase
MTAAAQGTLFVVATPIGNLEDITLRALRVLREVAVVAAEDTRRTRNLLRHYQIQTPLISLHEHNEERRRPQLIARLMAGESIALLSDAGTPGIADPGARTVRAARDAGVRVEPIPGASAVTTVLSASGIGADRFMFGGFPPIRAKNRIAWFQWISEQPVPVVFFEAPHRISKTLAELEQILVNRPIIVAREMTKIHEQWLKGAAAEVAAELDQERGEFVIVVEPGQEPDSASSVVGDEQISALFGRITDNGASSRREAVKLTAERLRLTPKTVYAALERVKKLV